MSISKGLKLRLKKAGKKMPHGYEVVRRKKKVTVKKKKTK